MGDDQSTGISDAEQALVGCLVGGTVRAVFTWGVIVDLGLSRPGLIDPLYIDDGDRYQVGQQVRLYVTSFDGRQQKFWVRPPDQVPVADRLRRKGHDL